MTSALLLSPLGWIYYLWFLAPPVIAGVSNLDRITWRERLPGLALAGFLVPPFLPLSALAWSYGLGTLTVGSVYFWALAVVWLIALRDPRKEADEANGTVGSAQRRPGHNGAWHERISSTTPP